MKYLEHSIKAEDTRYRDFTAEKDSYFQQSGIPFGFHSHPEQTGLGLGSILQLLDFKRPIILYGSHMGHIISFFESI